MSDKPLNVGQIVDALSQCDRALPVKFFDSDAERGFGIVFVEHGISSVGGEMVYLHRYVPNLDNIACEPIKNVSDRSPSFARVEYEESEE
jgi:hypothetical protein